MLSQNECSAEELGDLGKFGDTIRITPKEEVSWPYVESRTDYVRHGVNVADEDESIVGIFEEAQEAAMSIIE